MIDVCFSRNPTPIVTTKVCMYCVVALGAIACELAKEKKKDAINVGNRSRAKRNAKALFSFVQLRQIYYDFLQKIFGCFRNTLSHLLAEVESSRTSLASRTSSRTDFEVLGLGLGLEGQVLGLGLEASSPRKLACPRLEDSTIFWKVKILWSG